MLSREVTCDTTDLQNGLSKFLKSRKRTVNYGLVEEVAEKTISVLEEALGIEVEEVTYSASLAVDLGAESIDYLDITYRMERAFDVRILSGEMFVNELPPGTNTEGFYDEQEHGFRYSDKGMAALRRIHGRVFKTMSDADRKRFERTRSPSDFVNGQNVLDLMVAAYDLCEGRAG